MFKTFKKAIILALGCITLSYAQESVLLEDVQITANRYSQKQIQTGKTVNVITDSTLRANEGLTLGQLLQNQTGILIIGSGQPKGSVQSLTMRGAGFGQSLILLDGVPVYDPSGIGNTFDLNHIRIQDLERIEILRDGQSVIYGSDAMAGVINLISKKPSNKKIGFNAGLMGGSYGTLNADASVKGALNSTGYAVGLSSQNSKGFSSAAAPGSEIFEKDGYKNLALNARLTQQISSALQAQVFFSHKDYKADMDEGAFTDDEDYTFKSENNQYGAGLEYKINDLKITFNYLGSQLARSYTNDSLYVSPAAWSKYSFNDYNSVSNFFEAYSNIKLSDPIRLLVGANYKTQNMDYSGFEISDFGKTDYDAINSSLAHINESGVYATLSSHFNSGFGLELGSRLNNHRNYGTHFTYNINPFFLFKDNFKIFASYGTSYRNPALYQLFSPYGNDKLNPEMAKTFEAGLQLFGNRAGDFLRLVAFGRKYDDMIIFAGTSEPPYGIYENLSEKTIQKGFELEGEKKWSSLTTGFNYTYLAGTISDNLENDSDAINSFLRRPNHTLNLKAGYQFGPKFSLALQSHTVSKRNDTFFNSNTFATEAKILDAYTLANLQAGYNISDWLKLTLSGQNILNKEYFEIYGYNSQKASFLLGLRANL